MSLRHVVLPNAKTEWLAITHVTFNAVCIAVSYAFLGDGIDLQAFISLEDLGSSGQGNDIWYALLRF